jgi:hypothetical protein
VILGGAADTGADNFGVGNQLISHPDCVDAGKLSRPSCQNVLTSDAQLRGSPPLPTTPYPPDVTITPGLKYSSPRCW